MACGDAVRLDELLLHARELPPDKQKKVAAILGSVVADAAGTYVLYIAASNAGTVYLKLVCLLLMSPPRNAPAAQPLHWVYKPEALKKAVEGIECPEFLPKSANPFYSIPTGSQSPYGDQLVNMLESLVASKGE